MYVTTFKRVEKKYLLNQEEYTKFMDSLKDYLTKDEYFKSYIYNVYYDTENFDLIRKSLGKPIYKEKVRLRKYKGSDVVFLEIKKKYKGIVYKRRISCSKSEFDNYIDNNVLFNNSQKMKEIDYLFKHYNLLPKVFLAYDRLSYKCLEDTSVRITFDTNIRSRFDNLSLEDADSNEYYFKDKMYLMEIKACDKYPLRICKLLDEMKLYPVSFSKYGSVYKEFKESEVNV